jgi:hypothetical protein
MGQANFFLEARELLRRSYEALDAYFDETSNMECLAYRGFQQERRDDLENFITAD